MTQTSRTRLTIGAALLLAAWQLGTAPASQAQVPPPPPQPPAAPESPGPEGAVPPALSMPAIAAGALVANPTPITFDTGPFGKLYLTGVVSGLGLFQTNPVANDRHTRIDLSNGQVFLQKSEGPVQFFVQAGAYSLPALGAPYFNVAKTTGNFYGPVPQVFLKLAPTDEFSFQVGKLPTLIGAEYTFTFENMNIQRGLLWNQENAVNRGIQANYTTGPLALSLSLNDGFYSNNYTWVSGLAAYTINPESTVSIVGMGNLGRTAKATLATPLAQNNSRIINLIYTYNAAPWTITPYFQFTDVPNSARLGIASARTYGGAVLANYKITDTVNIAGRAEYIASTGPGNVLYGPGSSAGSLTVTPSWQNGVWFLRGEGSVVRAFGSPGAFGKNGTAKTQLRGVLETGVIF